MWSCWVYPCINNIFFLDLFSGIPGISYYVPDCETRSSLTDSNSSRAKDLVATDRWRRKWVQSRTGWMCVSQYQYHRILNLQISCMSFIKHCCLDEYGMSNSCILDCYCSFWGRFTRDCLLIIYLRLLVSAVTTCKIMLFWSRLWKRCANKSFSQPSHMLKFQTLLFGLFYLQISCIKPVIFFSACSTHFMFSRDVSQLFIFLLYSEVEPEPS